VSLGTPLSLQVNRYYTVDFFRQVRSILTQDGILAFKISTAGAYLGTELASLVAGLKNACEGVFDHVVLLPGDYIHFVASADPDLDSYTLLLANRLQIRGLSTEYISPYRLWDRLSPIRKAHLDSLVAKHDGGQVNSDAKPICFSHAIAVWAKHFRSGRMIAALASRLTPRSYLLLLVLTGGAVVGLHLLGVSRKAAAFAGVLAIYSMGLTTMFTQILIILSFQITSGYIYIRIAALVAAFMVGMGTASTLMSRTGPSRRPVYLPLLHSGLVLMPIAVAMIFDQLSTHLSWAPLSVTDLLFVLAAALTGLLGGSIFALGSSLLAPVSSTVGRAAALAYSADLSGAAVAGITTGLFVIPALGLIQSAYVVSIFNTCSLVAIMVGLRGHRGSRPH
jgi:spermidine synthase